MGRQRKYLESTTRAALLLCCVGLLSACGSDDLERDEAATMIEEKIGKAVANTVPVDKGAIESWGQRLEFTHSANGMLSGNYILDSVVPEVAQIDAGPLMVVLKAPVHYKIVVTGITAPSPESNERIVEYSVTQENVPVIVRLLSRKDWRGKIKFAKYDDGWRIGESLGATFGGPVLESELTPAERAEIDNMILAVDQRRAAQQREREEVAKAAEAARRAFDAAIAQGVNGVGGERVQLQISRPAPGSDAKAWRKYLVAVVMQNMQGVMTNGLIVYFVPEGAAAERDRSNLLESAQITVAHGLQSSDMLVFGGPDSKLTGDMLVASFTEAGAGKFKGVTVLFVGATADRSRVEQALKTSGASFRFAEMK